MVALEESIAWLLAVWKQLIRVPVVLGLHVAWDLHQVTATVRKGIEGKGQRDKSRQPYIPIENLAAYLAGTG